MRDGPPDRRDSSPTHIRLTLDDRCRALARVVALIEGRGMQVGELRFLPAGGQRPVPEAEIQVEGPEAAVPELLARIEALPSVRSAVVGPVVQASLDVDRELAGL